MNDLKLLEQLATNLAMQTQLLTKALGVNGVSKEAAAGTLLKTPQVFQDANPLHGWNGLWSTPGLSRDIISAHIRPMGIADHIPMISGIDQDPRFGSLTGFTAAVGSQPTNVCDTAPKGYVKGCNLTARFGRIRFDTNTIDMDTVMLRVNRGDFTDLLLRGQVLGLTNVGPSGLNQDQILNVLTMSEMVTVGVLFEREITRQIWQGVTTIANEFPGLAVQVATGQKDADTNVLCPALDSDVKSYNYATLSNTIVTYLSMLEHYLFNNATRMGLMPVKWVFAMRPELWLELSAVWACAYNTNRCSDAIPANTTVSIDGREMVALRDSMRAGMYIDINGRRYDVVTDDGIFEHNNTNNANCAAGEYASTIYMLPVTIQGGFPVLYREHVDYTKAAADVALLNGKQTFWSDGGVYSWALEQHNWCYMLAAKTEQRVVLRTPQLAGRIDAIKYVPLQHLRSPFPDNAYFMDGGVSIRGATQSPYSIWSTRG